MVALVRSKMFGKMRVVGMMFLVALGSVACQTKPVVAPPPPVVAPPPPPPKVVVPKVVDTKAQQLNYDRGVQAYSKEDYEEARAAFQRVIDLGPKTELASKAKENLKKVMQVLKTVDEIKSK